MMGSDIDLSSAPRRVFLAHCSAAAWLGLAAGRAAAVAQGPKPRLLVLGDSLSAEYGLARGTGWVALLEKRLTREGMAWQVVNASISGETTSGGRSRLPALLKQHLPRVVIIELGGNDALRGLPLAITQANLTEMARLAKAAHARVLVAGITVPPNYGRAYGEGLLALFGTVAKAEGTALVPFLLSGVADAPNADDLFQPDRIHPKAEAQARMLDNVWPALRPLLRP
jgi:acyl-CoA thioesterase-1